MGNSPACALCETHDAEGHDVVPCNHCGQRFSLDSSRSTRGGSEVPAFKTNLRNEKGTFMSDTKIVQAVGSKIKAVFGKGKENKRRETEMPAS